jgi:hypothetical protein
MFPSRHPAHGTHELLATPADAEDTDACERCLTKARLEATSEIDDHDPAIVILVEPVGLMGRSLRRSRHVQRELQTRLFGV